jgi:hypothetical protein
VRFTAVLHVPKPMRCTHERSPVSSQSGRVGQLYGSVGSERGQRLSQVMTTRFADTPMAVQLSWAVSEA